MLEIFFVCLNRLDKRVAERLFASAIHHALNGTLFAGLEQSRTASLGGKTKFRLPPPPYSCPIRISDSSVSKTIRLTYGTLFIAPMKSGVSVESTSCDVVN